MSNKTQLQTNNTKLDTLTSLAASMIEKAAALPEAGSGGATLQAAEGRFTPTSASLSSNPITISGLPFTPELVIIMYNGTGRTAYASNKTILGSIAFGLINSATAIQRGTSTSYSGVSLKNVPINAESGYCYIATINSDGFTLSTSGAYEIASGHEYVYLAIGTKESS